MSDAKSQVLENQIINHTLGGTACPQPTEWWIAIYDEDPTDNVTSVIPAALSAPIQVPDVSGTTWSITGNTAVNAAVIEFIPVPATETWAVSHYALFDAESNGRPLYQGSFNTIKTLDEGDILRVDVGAISLMEN